MNEIKNILKVILAIGLLLPYIEPPYSYYQILRIGAAGGMVFFIASPNKTKYQMVFTVLYIIGCILFQPFEKISFERDVWLVVDTIFSGIVLTDLITSISSGKKEKTPADNGYKKQGRYDQS